MEVFRLDHAESRLRTKPQVNPTACRQSKRRIRLMRTGWCNLRLHVSNAGQDMTERRPARMFTVGEPWPIHHRIHALARFNSGDLRRCKMSADGESRSEPRLDVLGER